MQIRDIETELTNFLMHPDEFLRDNVQKLVTKLDEQIKEENQNINYGRAEAVITSYKNQHETLCREFNNIPITPKNTLARLYKAQEVLVTIDTVMYYVKWALSRCTGVNADNKMVMMLRSDEEYFKESSFRWCQVVSSINSEIKLKTVILNNKGGRREEEN